MFTLPLSPVSSLRHSRPALSILVNQLLYTHCRRAHDDDVRALALVGPERRGGATFACFAFELCGRDIQEATHPIDGALVMLRYNVL